MVYFGEHLKTKAFGQTVLPDMSLLIGQKFVENAKIEKLKCDILDDFQTLCDSFLDMYPLYEAIKGQCDSYLMTRGHK